VSACPRCGGTVIVAREAGGQRDDHCLACGWRPGGLTAEQHAAIVAERNALDASGKRRRVVPPRMTGGVA